MWKFFMKGKDSLFCPWGFSGNAIGHMVSVLLGPWTLVIKDLVFLISLHRCCDRAAQKWRHVAVVCVCGFNRSLSLCYCS